jgi:CHASE3 domain sensor protein
MTTSHRSKILFSFCVAILLLCAVGISVYSNFIKMNKQKVLVERTYAVKGDLQELLSNMMDIQSSQRG